MYINKKSPIPVYYQLKNIILKKIGEGEYAPGSLIPSERDLGESLNISRMTVRQALNQLVSEGVLYREKGKGTFVSKGKIQQNNIMSFSDTVRQKGLMPSTEIIAFQKELERYDIKEILEIGRDEVIYVIKRLRLANDLPIAIEEAFIPEKYCPGLEDFDLKSSLYRIIKEQYSYTVNYIDNTIEASRPTKEEKELLKVNASLPILRINGISYTETGLKLFYEKDVYRSDEYSYNVRIYMNKDN